MVKKYNTKVISSLLQNYYHELEEIGTDTYRF